MYFTKIKSDFFLDLAEQNYYEEFANFGSVVNDKFLGIKYNRVNQQVTNFMLEIIPEEYRQYFHSGIMHINAPYIRPHTDSDTLTVLNFYQQTADAVTMFYNIKNNNPDKIKNQTSGYVYNLKDLSPLESFVAKAGDVWLLDVSKPHSVLSSNKEERIALCLHTNKLTYKDVKNILTS
jgi:hypothetical protein